MSKQIAETADFLAHLRAAPQPIQALPLALRPAELTTAYQSQDALVAQLLATHGGQRIGYKIACTNEIAQRQLHISTPLYGQLLAYSTYPSPARLDPPAHRIRVRLDGGGQAHRVLPRRGTQGHVFVTAVRQARSVRCSRLSAD